MADYTKIDGVAAADIVKIDGIAIADVEKVDGTTKPAGNGGVDWDSSLWMDDNLTSNLGTWTGDTAKSSLRKIGGGSPYVPNNSYTTFPIPFLDDSGGTKYLKMCLPANMSATTEIFEAVDVGTRVQVNSGNHPDIVCITATGVAFSGGSLADGQHVVQYRWYHEGGKTDTYYNVTGVIDCSSNVLTFANRNKTTTLIGSRSYYTAAETLASPFHGMELTYDPSDNTWSQTDGWNYGEGWWHGTGLASGVLGPDSDAHGIECVQPAYYIDSDTDEHRMFYFKSA